VSETIFSSAADALIQGINKASIEAKPFPYFYVDNIFPEEFYMKILEFLPNNESVTPIENTGRVAVRKYNNRLNNLGSGRFVLPIRREELQKLNKRTREFWLEVAKIVNGRELGYVLLEKFKSYLQLRFGAELDRISFVPDVLLIRDKHEYSLGPHTDAPHRAVVLILYLPDTDSNPELGTSVYVPQNKGFECPGGPHHGFEKFDRIFTAPYLPNSAFGFVKTTNSFHGVEPFPEKGLERNLIHYVLHHDRQDMRNTVMTDEKFT